MFYDVDKLFYIQLKINVFTVQWMVNMYLYFLLKIIIQKIQFLECLLIELFYVNKIMYQNIKQK